MTQVSTVGGIDASATVEGDPDMTGVDPLRRQEVRRRVAAVRSFAAIDAPTDVDRRAHADRLGLSVNQFLALVRAWREHGRAAALAASGKGRGSSRTTGPRHLPTASKAAALEVIATLGPDTPHVEAERLVRARCQALQVRPPSSSTIWNMIMAGRRDAAPLPSPAGIIVATVHAKLPVLVDAAIVLPALTLAVNATDGAIVAAARQGVDSSAAIATYIDARREAGPLMIDREVADRIAGEIGPGAHAVAPSAARTALAKSLGRGFGSIDILYQRRHGSAAERVLRSLKDQALSPEDGAAVLGGEMRSHNARRGVPPPTLAWEAADR